MPRRSSSAKEEEEEAVAEEDKALASSSPASSTDELSRTMGEGNSMFQDALSKFVVKARIYTQEQTRVIFSESPPP